MSLHTVAKHMAAHGRGPDDHLVHMSGKEVAGLQALAQAHGGSLTVNPHTGLPEAGLLDDILPTVIGAGIGVATGSPWLAAGIMGGGTFLNTGDLGKGLMAGLGGYGAGSLGAGLATLGGGELAADASKAAAAMGMSPEEALAAQTKAQSSAFGNAAKGLSTAMENPALGMEAAGGWGNIGMAAAPAILGMLGTQKPQAPQGTTTQQMIRPYTFDYKDTVASGKLKPSEMVGTTYTPGQDTSERTWVQPTYTALPPYKAAQGGLMAFANGGTSSLGGYSDGGRMLKGPGDGMSDSIPAQIGDKQPARLADGEFVVPADVVSHLGNGSTDAGAKQLYKMMDRIRQQRTGKKKQAPQVNPSKAMPA